MVHDLGPKGEATVEDCFTSERRRNKRYALGFPLQFTLRGRAVDRSGTGTAINMSSTGLLFRSETAVLRGDPISALIDWPRTAGRQRLLLQGHVIWSQTPLVAISFSRHIFVPSVGSTQDVSASIRDLRDTARSTSTRNPFPLIVVVESVDTFQLVAKVMSNYPLLHVGAASAVKLLKKESQFMGLLITDTLREFAPLKLSTPVIYISPGENDRELDQVVLFSSIVVLRKPLTVGALSSAVRQLAAKSTTEVQAEENAN